MTAHSLALAGSQIKSNSHYDRRSVLVSSPIWGPRPDFVTVRQLRFCRHGASCLTRGRVCHLSRSYSEVHDIYICNFTCRHSTQSFVKNPVPCGPHRKRRGQHRNHHVIRIVYRPLRSNGCLSQSTCHNIFAVMNYVSRIQDLSPRLSALVTWKAPNCVKSI
jgi:hypothetical protein